MLNKKSELLIILGGLLFGAIFPGLVFLIVSIFKHTTVSLIEFYNGVFYDFCSEGILIPFLYICILFSLILWTVFVLKKGKSK